MRLHLVIGFGVLMSACSATAPDTNRTSGQDAGAGRGETAHVSAKSFVRVVEKMEPVAERICKARAPRADCDFQIAVDTRTDQPPNAYQTVDKDGRPILVFNVSLIAKAQNRDELAFVLGHEAAHHISGHLDRTRDSAVAGSVIGGVLATLAGVDASLIGTAQELGASVGARTFSKDFELEADRLGTVIAYRAGYDPERGARFFTRIPDPGDQFLGTHPPNAQRVETVRETVALLR